MRLIVASVSLYVYSTLQRTLKICCLLSLIHVINNILYIAKNELVAGISYSFLISSLVMMVRSLHQNQSQKKYPSPDILVITP